MGTHRPRVWLVTGASSGFGRAVTEYALYNNEIVSAAVRNPETLGDLGHKYGPDHLLVVPCNVASTEQITDAFTATKMKFGHIDIVLHCAGYAIVGEIEGTPEQTARDLFDVNFWATANVSKEAVKIFREQGHGGRLLNISSGAGLVGLIASGYYSASKHAVEGLTECLAKEVIPSWNIKISILEPGAFKTRAHSENCVILPAHDAYKTSEAPTFHVRNHFEEGSSTWGDVVKAAKKIFEFTKLENPPLRWQIGREAIEGIKAQMESILEESKVLENWSDDLLMEG
ncbi:hypothetical protein VKT23_016581 [Stygiomarasmius scandens]|uniref:NAD(P)-binding protein n=1 Tax=Marasmiellus scandens TaxID=2682957 RepID=A0ABR1IXL7_9AGAR